MQTDDPRRRRGWRERPHPSRMPPDGALRDTILARHAAAIAAGRPTYLDPRTGFEVFTAELLSDRGSCCDSGCRHCPYVGADEPGAGRADAADDS